MDGVLTLYGTPEPLYPLGRNGSQDGETYGGDVCAPHDQHLPPTCADDSGKPLVGAAEWCGNAFCYVDQDNCAIATLLSGFFPLSKLYYSYETCGAKNVYAEFARTCGCRVNEYHTQGMPPPVDDPPLQPDGGMGGPAKDWQCEACLDGARCSGATAASMRVLPGWFVVRSMSSVTGAEKRPKLVRCPGGIASCPGGASITAAMGALPSTAKTAVRTCESITNSTGMEEGDFDAVRLQQYPQCQCSRGGTGMLCGTCKSSAVVGGNNWVAVRGIGGGCKECTMRSADATTMVGVTMFGILFLVLCAALFKCWYTRPSLMEMRFVGAFRHINTLGATKIVEDFFGVKVGSGITRDVFVAAVVRRCGGKDKGGGGSRGGGGRRVKKTNALKLWGKLDEDNDGEVSLDEFVTFVCELRDGKKGAGAQSRIGKAGMAFVGSVLEWWRSMKSQTLRAVIITHFQVSWLRPMNVFTRTYTLIRSSAH